MNKFIAFLYLIRLPNLVIIALTQYMLRWCIFRPILSVNDLHLQFSESDFFLLVLSTVMIAAAGYIINDYFDLRVDRINRPERVIVGRYIKRRVAMGAHLVINVIAIAIGIAISVKTGIWKLSFFHVFSAVSLWYYAVNFKRQLLIGNFVIALLAALVSIIVGAFEIPLLINTYEKELNEMIQQSYGIYTNSLPTSLLWYWCLGYALFAFILTLAREIIKDMADYKGDKAIGCKTIPIMCGYKNTAVLVAAITGIAIISLTYVQQAFLADNRTFIYFLFFIQLPLLLSVYFTFKGKDRKTYLKASNWSKFAMVAGILYAVLVWYIIFING